MPQCSILSSTPLMYCTVHSLQLNESGCLYHIIIYIISNNIKGLFVKNRTIPSGDRFCCESGLLSILKWKEKSHLWCGGTEGDRCTSTVSKQALKFLAPAKPDKNKDRTDLTRREAISASWREVQFFLFLWYRTLET